MRRRPGGMTLLEMSVTMGLLVLLAGCMMQMLLSAEVAWKAVRQEGLMASGIDGALMKMTRELKYSDPATVTVTAGPAPGTSALAFLSAVNAQDVFVTDGAGRPVWQQAVVWYVAADGRRLLRRVVPGTYGAALTPAQVTALANGQGQQLAEAVTTFAVVSDPAAGEVRVTLAGSEGDATARGPGRQGATTAIVLRNGETGL